jgi:hypothetical protein
MMMQQQRPGLFGGLANMAKRGFSNFMNIPPEVRLRMGMGAMSGGLPEMANQYLTGQQDIRERNIADEERKAREAERLFQTQERQRQADTQAAQQMAREMLGQSMSPTNRLRLAAGLDPEERPDLPDGYIYDDSGRPVEIPGYFEHQMAIARARRGGVAGRASTTQLPTNPSSLVWE